MSTEGLVNAEAIASDLAIRARGVGKRYDIYSRNLHRLAHAFTRNPRYAREFWALREVSFDVKRGEAVGIVGRNGSGKSTLMQIIAGTLAPSEGEVAIRGRISALLELGSGFNLQFTGRENVYLAGSILGLSRREMNEKFDAIAAFADIGEFLDQPVEVYSSGMHARLAFSVAVCVEPDVLIVDEILSVGDAGFQQKCLSRMRRSIDSGMTLLLVSHSADMVKSVCSRALYLHQGRQVKFGPAGEAVDLYMQSMREETTAIGVQNAARTTPLIAQEVNGATPRAEVIDDPSGLRYGTGHARIESVRLLDEAAVPRDGFSFGDTIVMEVQIAAKIDMARTDLVFVIRDKAGVDVFGSTAIDEGAWIGPLKAGERRLIRLSFASPLAPGAHGLSLTLMRRPDVRGEGVVTLDHMDAAAAFESLGANRVVRGKVHIPVKAEIVVLAPAAVSSAAGE
jgi:lipopolysaccharide transport system ATP-binding protein